MNTPKVKCCIQNNCGMPFDPAEPETRPANTLRSFWQRYCPKHRTGGNANNPIITEQKVGRSKAAHNRKIPRKRILSVTIRRMVDTSPDASWLGEYSNSPKTEYAIDRKHSLTCPVNTPASDPLWISTSAGRIELKMTLEQAESISHSGECDEDVKELSQVPEIKSQLEKLDKDVLVSELKEYGAWDAEELSDHSQNLQRILWILGCDLAENHGCDCGERGDAGRNEY